MSIRDNNKVLIVQDGTTGQIIDNIKINTYNYATINSMIMDIFYKYEIEMQHDLIIKTGYES